MKISNISFGEVILSDKLRNVMVESQENPEELSHFQNEKPDCYIDLRCNRKGQYYLQAVETWENHGLNNKITEKLYLKNRRIPYVSDLLTIYERFKQSVEKRNTKFFDFD